MSQYPSPDPSFQRANYDSQPQQTFVPAPANDPTLFAKAIAFGLVGAAIGAVVYAGFIYVTHIQIGYLAIGVAWLIAKGMEIGSKGTGGRPYQITAIVLTILAVSVGNSLMLYWRIASGLHALHPAIILKLLQYGLEEPFLEFQSNAVGAALGLFILFIGLRAAWRMTSGVPGAANHPFSR